MIIGIEAERANQPQKTGVEHYAQQLILHLAAIDAENQYVLYLRAKPEDWFFSLPENFTVKVIPFPVFWTQLRISWEMLVHPVDVLFIPASALPIIHPKKTVVTIHDLAWIFYPQAFTWFNRNFLKFSTWFAVKSASKIIAVSEATKKDLIKVYQINSDKVIVVHHGYKLEVSRQPARRSLDEVGEPLINLPQHYILFLSTLQPRKNLGGLIKAFRQLKQELPELPHKLVVVGKPGWKFEAILKKIDENKDIVVYFNHILEAEKFAVLKGATALVLPSFYEGFGMQILEAFAAGVPVAASNVSSLPEVAGEAAVYFDPGDVNQIKSAVKNILLDKALADRLRAKGQERLKQFSWQKCAEETLKVLLQ
jgi:glycosyltransferase involved in cell wall biosynthesis